MNRLVPLVVIAAAAPALAAGKEKMKLYSFDDLSRKQMQQYHEKVDLYAMVESSLQLCGMQTNFEKLIVSGTEKCVTPGTVKRAVADFRKRIQFHRDQSRRDMKVPVATFCANARDILNKFRAAALDAADEASRMCKSYLVGLEVRNSR